MRSRAGGGDRKSSLKGKAVAGKKDDEPSDDGPVSRRVTRSMKWKSNFSGAVVDKGRVEGGEDSEHDADEGIVKYERKRIGKRKLSEVTGAVVETSEKAQDKHSTCGRSQLLPVPSKIDKGKGLALGAATTESSKEMTAGTIVISSDDDDGGRVETTAGTSGSYDSYSESEMRIETEFREAMANGETSKSTRPPLRERRVRKNQNWNGETELRDSDASDSDFANEGGQGSTIGHKRRLQLLRPSSSRNMEPQGRRHVSSEAGGPTDTGRGAASRKRALDIARSRAAHFAHFNHEDADNGVNRADVPPSVEQAEHVRRAGELLAQAQAAGAGNEALRGSREDWPGPWTVARRLVAGRFAAAAARQDAAPQGPSYKTSSLVDWSPSRTANFCRIRVPPSLHQKCLEVLGRNFDHVESLDGVPDCDKKWLVNSLCATRRLTPAAVRLCTSVSPSEISIPDCTYLTEEQLTDALTSCSMVRLEVLELTMCGRGLTDRCLATVCAEKGSSFPELQIVALRGAYRLVDKGFSRILDAAPKLRSVDLTSSSLISESGVEAIADALGPKLESLVLDSCTQLNGLKLLPALRKMTNLQRLSLSAVPGVTDGVISELLVQLRFNLQELELRDCQTLTDAGIQAVSLCQGLKLLDVGYIPGLTDVALALITDNCRNLRALRLCRGKFTDTALAAFVSTSGSCLSELSVNSARLVGDRTMMALAQFSKTSLEILDVSWCRSISDQALGLVADSCSKLRTLKLFGCSQVTSLFLEGHSNEILDVTGIWECPTVTPKAS